MNIEKRILRLFKYCISAYADAKINPEYVPFITFNVKVSMFNHLLKFKILNIQNC